MVFLLMQSTKDKADAGEGGVASSSAFELDPPTYTYADMLGRVVDLLAANNPELAEKRRQTVKPPQLMRVGTKKTLWVNFQEICKIDKKYRMKLEASRLRYRCHCLELTLISTMDKSLIGPQQTMDEPMC